MSPRMQIVWDALEAAKDTGDELLIATCRRLIEANRRGWKTHHNPADYQLVKDFAQQ